jgi:hypothetical protein
MYPITQRKGETAPSPLFYQNEGFICCIGTFSK